jgi:hypothetical protein
MAFCPKAAQQRHHIRSPNKDTICFWDYINTPQLSNCLPCSASERWGLSYSVSPYKTVASEKHRDSSVALFISNAFDQIWTFACNYNQSLEQRLVKIREISTLSSKTTMARDSS